MNRPGTAPKQAIMNKLASGVNQNMHGRPMSPYNKAYGAQNQIMVNG